MGTAAPTLIVKSVGKKTVEHFLLPLIALRKASHRASLNYELLIINYELV
ncbi:hypothetical protein GXM_04023 [Nostoc sphaeroides CCNUC1]|uniref:Uncharacterized protein n=1 Tax=Nostoc sphaeroides CCNUC1 TaxID=2653204 RepID=A0A5P8W1K9_9NOSO|nr:hypothetical protein GXM_04023 [Nostoc sphaeroides CCNUC1]